MRALVSLCNRPERVLSFRCPGLCGGLLVLAALLSGCVTPTDRPLLWQIETQPPSYVYGTIHLPDQRVLAIPEVVRRAVASVDVVYAEVPLEAGAEQAVLEKGKLPEGHTLRDVLPPELYERTDKYLRSRGLRLAAFERYRVWVVIGTLEVLDYLGDALLRPPLDMRILQLARQHRKATAGLETIDEQLAALDAPSPEEQTRWLARTLDTLEQGHRDGRSTARHLVDVYLRGDEAEIETVIMSEYDPTDPLEQLLFQRLLIDRNARMAERIVNTLHTQPARGYFFAVGAAHLVGTEGVLARLARSGYGCRRLTAAEAAEIVPPARPYAASIDDGGGP